MTTVRPSRAKKERKRSALELAREERALEAQITCARGVAEVEQYLAGLKAARAAGAF